MMHHLPLIGYWNDILFMVIVAVGAVMFGIQRARVRKKYRYWYLYFFINVSSG